MLDRTPTVRTYDWRPGYTIPIGWVVECIVLIILACAMRDVAKSCTRIANAIERIEQNERSVENEAR